MPTNGALIAHSVFLYHEKDLVTYAGQGMLERIFSISALVKARSACVRMLPRMSADNNTPAAVSSSGASKTHT